MSKYRRGEDRDELLADVAEMYYEEAMTQAQISHAIGVTRSAVSRMLTEARDKDIVRITVHRPTRFDEGLEEALTTRFNLLRAHVLVGSRKADSYAALRGRLGAVAAQMLTDLLEPEMVVGAAWGTTVAAAIEAFEPHSVPGVTVVQLVGVLGSSSHAFNAHALVEQLASKTGGSPVYLYTPFLVDNAETARSLLQSQNVREVLEIGRQCSLALLGIGSTEPERCSLFQGGHISRETLEELRQAKAVGDVSGHHFDISGRPLDLEFHDRLVGIAREDLLSIRLRLGVAGGVIKAPAVLGALRGGFVNLLVTDAPTAARVLELDDESG
jgi:DNA-binding transcriptional regulator LsrR (DeoR family)